LQLREGAAFGLEAYAADRARLLRWYKDEGYPDARVAAAIEPGPDGLGVTFLATPGPRVVVGRVRTARESRTRASVFDDAVVTPAAQPVRARDLDESRERLSESRAFRSVDLRLEPRQGDPGVRDVVVDVVERNGLDLEYGLRYVTGGTGQVGGAPTESDAGFQVGAGVEAINPFGWAHRTRFYGLIGPERRLLSARHDMASFFGRRWATQLFVFDDTAHVPEATQIGQRVVGATFQQTKRWRRPGGNRFQDRARMQWGYSYKWIEYIEVETRESLSGLRAGLLHTISGDSRDSITDPRRGVFWSLGTELSLRALGSDVDYAKLFGQLFLYTPLGRRVAWVQAYRVGVVPGDDPLLLLENRFMAGGASTVRGFAENGLGPRSPNDVALGGQAVIVFNQEVRLPIWRRLWGAVFYDAGNVFALAKEMDLGALRHSAGAGLRLMFPFGPVRFDWSHVLDPKEGERRSRWLFSIGHAF
jgi:outer membrane protein insertion porin family